MPPEIACGGLCAVAAAGSRLGGAFTGHAVGPGAFSGAALASAASQSGHSNPAMTAWVYLGRKGDTSSAAAVL